MYSEEDIEKMKASLESNRGFLLHLMVQREQTQKSIEEVSAMIKVRMGQVLTAEMNVRHAEELMAAQQQTPSVENAS